ncbi:MAG: DegT/DnrJ/EryC1/StrS family aminotransferase [Candidatus Marinamargulisbacteria bacterium]
MKNVRLSKSIIGDKEKRLVQDVLNEEYLGMGRYVQTFENNLSLFLNNKVSVVNSGTAALHLALLAIGVGQGDEVLVPSLTYVASYQAISATGALPISCDVLIDSGHIDIEDARKKVTSNTKAIMPVHYAGNPVNYEQIQNFANKYKLRVIEDAAHAFGSLHQHGKKVGEVGDIICFSFDGIKNITSGEGGAVVTSDESIIQFVNDARLLGVHKDSDARYEGKRSWEFDVQHQGFRYHMSNLFAGVGLAQLERFELEFKPTRQTLAKQYFEQLKTIPNVQCFKMDFDQVVPHIFPIKVLKNRDQLRAQLIEQGIEAGIHYFPNHRLSFYKKPNEVLVNTDTLYEQLITLPLHPEVTREDQLKIVKIINEFSKRV